MITFQTTSEQINLTHLKPSLNEENNWFTNDTVKNYSIPFLIDTNSDIAKKLGLPNVKNISNYQTIIKGRLIIDYDFFDAYIELGEVQGYFIEATLFYGEKTLTVYQEKLKNLGWPIITTSSLKDYAESIIDKSYPEVTHNFPLLYRPSIREKEDYEDFLLFVNNYTDATGFVTNAIEIIGEDTFFRNYSVMSPFVYVLEILRFGYQKEGIAVSGKLFELDLFKSLVYVPETYFERFLSGTYDAYQFDFATNFTVINTVEMAIFERVYIPTLKGSYQLSVEFHFDQIQAAYFLLEITLRDATSSDVTVYFSATSQNNFVNISKDFDINIEEDNLFDELTVRLIIPRQTYSIASYNSIEYSFKEGRLNTPPTQYSLANFMPDMTFGDFENVLKNWLNLDIVVKNNVANFNFVEDKIQSLEVVDKSHLQDPLKHRKLNKNRFFVMKNLNEELVNVDNSGRVFTDPLESKDIINLDADVYMLPVSQNFDKITGVFNEDIDGMQFGFYNGLIDDLNYMPDTIDSERLSMEEVYDRYWKLWLQFRTNSKTYTEKFKVHISELFDLKKAMFKYNDLHIIKKITKKRVFTKFWQIDSESETF